MSLLQIQVRKSKFFWVITTGLVVLSLFGGIFLNKVVHADELSTVYSQKDKKQKELESLEKQIQNILKSNKSLSAKITEMKKEVKKAEELQKYYAKETDKYAKLLNKYGDEKKKLYTGAGKVFLEGPGFVEFANTFVTRAKEHKDFSFIDSLMTFLTLREYYTDKFGELSAKEQQAYGNFLYYKKNLDASNRLVADTKGYLKELNDQYAKYKSTLYVSYAKKSALVNEITALSAKARKIIEQKARDSGGSNTIGGSGGGSSSGGAIPVGNSGANYTIKYGSTTKSLNTSKLYISTTGTNCAGGSSVPGCSNGYTKVMILNANKSKNGGTWYYRGTLVVDKNLTGAFFINRVTLEEYVLGIGEMPSSWGANNGAEALKAQAVAARTYAYSKGIVKGLTLFDTTLDQNYVGTRKEIYSYGNYWVQAVASTAGRILKSGGNVITAYYHSSCGGSTLSTQEVWGGYRPYALGISDRYQSNGKWVSYDKDSPYSAFARGDADVPMIFLKDILNASIYLQRNATGTYIPPAVQDKIACQLPKVSQVSSPLSFSKISTVQASKCSSNSYTASQLHSALGNYAIDKQFDTISKVYVTFKDKNGQASGNQFNIGKDAKYTDSVVVEGKKNGATKKVYIPAGFFKLAYNLRSPGSNYIGQSSKNGALYDIWQKVGDYSARTYGLGHRVGMCQYGAYGRAKKGQTYAQILSAYYANLDYSNGLPTKVYNDRGPIVSVKISQPGRALCPSSYSCDSSIKNGTYITKVTANAGNLIIKDASGNVVATVPAGTWVEIKR